VIAQVSDRIKVAIAIGQSSELARNFVGFELIG